MGGYRGGVGVVFSLVTLLGLVSSVWGTNYTLLLSVPGLDVPSTSKGTRELIQELNLVTTYAQADAISEGSASARHTNMRIINSGCSSKTALLNYVPEATKNDLWGLVGGWCSSASIPMSFFSGNFEIPHISYGAESSELEDKFKHPYFLRTTTSVATEAAFRVALCEKFGWTKVATIGADDPYANSLQNAFARQARLAGIDILNSASFPADWDPANPPTLEEQIKALKSSKARVFILTPVSDKHCLHLYPILKAAGMTDSADYAWITSQWCWDGGLASELKETFAGFLYMKLNGYDHPRGQSFTTRMSAVTNRAPQFSTGCAYDALKAFFSAGDRVISSHPNQTTNAILDGDKVLAELKKTSFSGVTGEVAFNEKGNRQGLIGDIYNIGKNSVIKVVGRMEFAADGTKAEFFDSVPIYWPGGRPDPVPNTFPTEEEKTPEEGLSMLSLILIFIGVVAFLAIIAGALFWLHVRGKKRRILSSAPSGVITVVFTDIQGSTLLWEKFPDAMQRALETHNTIALKLAKQMSGYEVKTIGDSFMLAFSNPADALRFSGQFQLKLVEAEWDEELMGHELAREVQDETGKVIWKGLRVRIGMQLGEPNVTANVNTGKVDYHGPCVNEASGIESSASGGEVVISQEVFDKIAHTDLGNRFKITGIGAIKLKGVTDPKILYSALPIDLAARATHNGGFRSAEAAAASVLCPKCSEKMHCPKCDGVQHNPAANAAPNNTLGVGLLGGLGARMPKSPSAVATSSMMMRPGGGEFKESETLTKSGGGGW